MTDWKNQFDSVTGIDRSSRFDSYKATKNGAKYFVKQVTEETDEWSRGSIDKEKEVYDSLDIKDYQIPSVHTYEPSNLLCVEWIDSYPWRNLHEDEKIENLVTDLADLVESLSRHGDLNLSTRWPNTDEFHHRLDATVSFNESGLQDLKPVISQSKEELLSMTVPDEDKSLVHGDLFYPNILFGSDGGVKSVIDWEIAGYFDQMYDVGFIESNVLDVASSYDNTFRRAEILSMFRDELNLTSTQVKRVKLYKIWPHYVKLASIDIDLYNPNYYPDSINPEEEVREWLDSCVKDCI